MNPEDLDDDDALLFIHRNIPGLHVIGMDCWCCPTVVRATEMETDINAQIARDALRH